MKKNFILASILAVSALLLSVSCAKIEQSEILNEVADDAIFTASIDQDVAKTILTEGYKVNWEAGDKININGATYSATPKDPATKADFTKTSGTNPKSPYKAVFPSTLYSNQAFSFPAIQTYQAGKFNAPMYAESETETLSFKNICGVICLSLKGTDKVKSISLVANEAVCGAFTMTDATTVNLTGTGKTITLNLGADGVQLSSDAATKFYIYLPPKEYSAGMKIIATDMNGLVFKKTTAKAVTVERSNVYTFDMTADFALALNGEFSVSPSKKVKFSQGNVYAKKNGTAWTWGFYDNQYAYNSLSTAESRTARTSDTEIDLFTWGYGTWSTSPTTSSYLTAIPEPGGILIPSRDWSTTIGDGTLWRSLTFDEWTYLLNGRDGAADKLKNGVTVCGKTNCLVIAPDNFVGAIESSYDAAAWDAAEEAGLVCLPAAGLRYGSGVEATGTIGFYWSSTSSGIHSAQVINFTSDEPEAAPTAVESITEAGVNGGQSTVTALGNTGISASLESAKDQFKNLTLTKGEKASAHKASAASNGIQQNGQKETVIKALSENKFQKVKNASAKRSGANAHGSRPAVKSTSGIKTLGNTNITIGTFVPATYEGEYYVTMTDANSTTQFFFDFDTSVKPFELGKTYTLDDMIAEYTAMGDAEDWYVWYPATAATYTETKDEKGLTHVVASMTTERGTYNITYDQPEPQDIEVTAVDWTYDQEYYDVYVASETTTYLFELKEDLVYGKTYTYADMVPSWTCTLTSSGYPGVYATDATLTVTKDQDGLIHIAATMTLSGDTYKIKYDEKPFVPTGVRINVDGTNLNGQYYSSYGFYCYTAKWGNYTVQLAFDATEEKATYTNDDFIAKYGLIYSSNEQIQLLKLASENITITDTDKTKTLTGSVYAKNGDEYVLNLVYEKPDIKEINIKVANATLTNRTVAGYWTIDGQTEDKNNSFMIYFIGKALQGSFTDVEKLDPYNTWVSDKSSDSNVYYENLSAVDLTSVVDGDSLKVTGTMNLADSKGNPAVATVYITTPFKQTWGEWNDFAPFDKNTGKYTFTVLFNNPTEQAKIPVQVRKDNTGLKQFKFVGWGKGKYTATGIDLIVDMAPDNTCTVPKQDTGLDSGYGENVQVQDYASKTGADIPSTYDPETGEFELALSYFISLGSFGSDYETMVMDKPITPKETITVNARKLGSFYEESVAGYVYQSDNETYSSIQFVTNSDQKLGKFTADDLQSDYSYLKKGTTRITFEEGEITVSEDEEGLKLTGRLIGSDENAYEFNLIQPAGAMEYDTDAPFDAEFALLTDISYSIENGVISINASNNINQVMNLEFYADPSATSVPAGTYVISDTKEVGTALKSKGVEGGYLLPCFAGVRSTSGGISDCWFMVEGTVTVSYNDYGDMIIIVAAKNSYGQDVTVRTAAGSSRDYGFSVRLVTDVK